jgi:fatty acid desaturase
VFAYSAINYWTDCIDHGGLVGETDELAASRNLVVPKILRVILFPRNDCYHLVHHLFPQVPTHHLDACHERLLDHPAYRARAVAETGRGAVEVEGILPAALR